MDVRCERCNTDYEFDDALVSGRGTTVKCTNCGHKFKIRRRDGDFSEDFWNVQTHDGRTLVFTSLRELQRAIQTNLVERHDLLSRGGLKQKPIGQIPELAPFFDQRDLRKSQPPPAAALAAVDTQTDTRVESASRTRSSRPPPPPGASAPPLAPPPRQRLSTRPDYPPPVPEPVEVPAAGASGAMPSMKKTLHGTGRELPAQEDAPQPRVLQAVIGSVRVTDAPPERRSVPPPLPAAAERVSLTRTQPIAPVLVPRVAAETPPPPAFEASSPLPPPTAPVLRTMNLEHDAHDAQASDDALAQDSEGARPRAHTFSDAPASLGRRRSVGGFIVAAVVVAGVALIGAVWAKGHLGGVLGARPAPVATTDPRVAGFLTTGEKALAEGNLETAKESFDKASALAEKDPRVLVDTARLATTRADIPWLRSRLLAADATDEIRFTKDALGELSVAARKAADEAVAGAPDDVAATRTKIDALRIAGDRDGARALVAKVGSSSAQPDTAYALAALDLADPEPLWSTVIEKLRVAASAEAGPGRARAALAYALARSGDVGGAKAEVERLASMSRQHPLLPQLRAFADRAQPTAKRDLVADGGAALAAHPDGGRRGPKDRPGGGGPAEPGRITGDGRQLVAQAEAARAKGDNERALSLYTAALEKNPSDTEALNGLAAIAHARRDLNGARAGYKRVLSINPSYVPALVGSGDVDWESGDRATAMKTYKEIVDRFPEGSYPARVKQRVDSASAPPPAPAPVPSPAPPPPGTDPGGGG